MAEHTGRPRRPDRYGHPRPHRGGRARIGALAAPLALVLLAGACSALPLSRTYLGSEDFGTTALAPAGWQVLPAEAVRDSAPGPGPAFLQGFGAAVADPTQPMMGDRPGGVLVVDLFPGLPAARLGGENAFLADLAGARASGAVTVIDTGAVSVEGVWEHRRWLLELRAPSGTVVRVLQHVKVGTRAIGAAADGAELYPVKSLIIGCSASCFSEEFPAILDVVDSWEVR